MIIRALALVLVLAVLGGGVWQHMRYLQVRRTVLDDRQPLVYAGRTFHVLTFVKIDLGKSIIDEVRSLRELIEVPGGGLVVYAGQAGPAVVVSEQIPSDWSALVFAQYPSRKIYDEFSASERYRTGIKRFERAYDHGVERSAGINLILPQGLLVLRLFDMLRGAPSSFPFVPAGDEASPKQQAKMKEMEQLDTLRSLREDAVVIFNLIKPGSEKEQSADRSYTRKMLRGMAEGGYGPMHMGRAITIEGEADFEQFAAVYYPGIDFLQKMIGSSFMARIGGDKQLGDSLAVVTVPIHFD